MTSYVRFTPSNITAPQFLATLDDLQYSIVVTWNVASQRYYINVYGINGAWIFTVPLIETQAGVDITSLSYDSTQGVMKATVTSPQWRPTGQIVEMVIEGCQPDSINGTYDCLMIDSQTLTFPVDSDPGQTIVLGSASRFMNMIDGYFQISSLIFRNGLFEIRP